MNILAVFRSRTQTLGFTEELIRCGVPAQIVSTPKQARIGCGLSCKLPYSSLPKARSLLGKGRYSSFAGFFTVRALPTGNEIQPL